MTTLADAELGQVSVVVKDVPRASAFYRDTLGLPFLFDAGDIAFVRAGATRLMLAKPSPGFEGSSSILYFKVTDIAAKTEALKSSGVVIVREPQLVQASPEGELWMAFFEDGEGNTHALMEERAAPAA